MVDGLQPHQNRWRQSINHVRSTFLSPNLSARLDRRRPKAHIVATSALAILGVHSEERLTRSEFVGRLMGLVDLSPAELEMAFDEINIQNEESITVATLLSTLKVVAPRLSPKLDEELQRIIAKHDAHSEGTSSHLEPSDFIPLPSMAFTPSHCSGELEHVPLTASEQEEESTMPKAGVPSLLVKGLPSLEPIGQPAPMLVVEETPEFPEKSHVRVSAAVAAEAAETAESSDEADAAEAVAAAAARARARAAAASQNRHTMPVTVAPDALIASESRKNSSATWREMATVPRAVSQATQSVHASSSLLRLQEDSAPQPSPAVLGKLRCRASTTSCEHMELLPQWQHMESKQGVFDATEAAQAAQAAQAAAEPLPPACPDVRRPLEDTVGLQQLGTEISFGRTCTTVDGSRFQTSRCTV